MGLPISYKWEDNVSPPRATWEMGGREDGGDAQGAGGRLLLWTLQLLVSGPLEVQGPQRYAGPPAVRKGPPVVPPNVQGPRYVRRDRADGGLKQTKWVASGGAPFL